ncbi:hypothetical protein BgiMline_026208, partial [Biomphalaria glabrata]
KQKQKKEWDPNDISNASSPHYNQSDESSFRHHITINLMKVASVTTLQST